MVLQRNVALVTGASRGIGLAIVEVLAHAGADVAINFNSHVKEAEEVAAQVRACGRRALLCQGDVSDREAVVRLIDQVATEWGRLGIAVADSAFSQRELFVEADLEQFQRTINVTMWGAFHVLCAAARAMISQRGGGTLLAVSSPHAYIPAADKPAWKSAPLLTDFYLAGSNTPATSRTTARLLWSDSHLYFAAEMPDSDVYGLNEGHDSPYGGDDLIELFVKPSRASPKYWGFHVTPRGATRELLRAMQCRAA